jgi:hypothetical protein
MSSNLVSKFGSFFGFRQLKRRNYQICRFLSGPEVRKTQYLKLLDIKNAFKLSSKTRQNCDVHPWADAFIGF